VSDKTEITGILLIQIFLLQVFYLYFGKLIVSCADSIRHGQTKQPETSTSGHQGLYMIFDHISPVLTLDSSEQYRRWVFLASIHVNLSHANETFFHGLLLLFCFKNLIFRNRCEKHLDDKVHRYTFPVFPGMSFD